MGSKTKSAQGTTGASNQNTTVSNETQGKIVDTQTDPNPPTDPAKIDLEDKEPEDKATLEAKAKQEAKELAEKASLEAKAKVADPYMELAKRYAKLYPDNKVFHITTDKQVFLSGNLSAAQNHQNSLSEGELKTIKL